MSNLLNAFDLPPLPACDCDDLAEANLRLRKTLAGLADDNLRLRQQVTRLEDKISAQCAESEWLDKQYVGADDRYAFKAWLLANDEAINVLRAESAWWQLWSRWVQATGGK